MTYLVGSLAGESRVGWRERNCGDDLPGWLPGRRVQGGMEGEELGDELGEAVRLDMGPGDHVLPCPGVNDGDVRPLVDLRKNTQGKTIRT